MAFDCKVQYLDDTDPFNSTSFPEPSRPPSYLFREGIPVGTQLQAIHRLLKAPHNVRKFLLKYWFFVGYGIKRSRWEFKIDVNVLADIILLFI